ncbi:MAG: hypothetical protein HUJ68_07410 [Clostridia bacterium]|mgnify:CR=1 FL=1|nr:hypothetical protein [Clostridia bacterium]
MNYNVNYFDWCWFCFSLGMELKNKNWVLEYPKLAKESYDWISFMKEIDQKEIQFFDDIVPSNIRANNRFHIQIPFGITFNKIYIDGFKRLIEEHIDKQISIETFLIETDKKSKNVYLSIYFDAIDDCK